VMLAGLLWPQIGIGEQAPVHVYSDSQSRAYQQVINGFMATMQSNGLSSEVRRVDSPLTAVASAKLALVLGDKAASQVLAIHDQTPVVVTMLSKPALLLGQSHITGVRLSFSMQEELTWISKAFPAQTDVGFLYTPAGDDEKIAAIRQFAQGIGIHIHAIALTNLKDLPEALRVLGKRADLIWGMDDSRILNAKTARTILAYTLKHKIPFVGPSAAWVRAGAAFALVRDYEDIGRQCGLLATSILQGAEPDQLAFQSPRKLQYMINTRVTDMMHISFSEEIIRGAVSR